MSHGLNLLLNKLYGKSPSTIGTLTQLTLPFCQEINWKVYHCHQSQMLPLSLYSKINSPSFIGAISKHITFIHMSADKDLFHQSDFENKL
jgi:hypothetical protein